MNEFELLPTGDKVIERALNVEEQNEFRWKDEMSRGRRKK
jgi:hypothetical protein